MRQDNPELAQQLYNAVYVQRAEACENSIKDLKNTLKADRQAATVSEPTSSGFCCTRLPTYCSSGFAVAQMDTLRLRLLKIACRVEQTARYIWLHFTSAYPWQSLWRLICQLCI